jgi:hypothetical protein
MIFTVPLICPAVVSGDGVETEGLHFFVSSLQPAAPQSLQTAV